MAENSDVIGRDYYEAMSREQLVARLKVAEDALVLSGWSTCRGDTPREKAATQMWMIWAAMVGGDFCSPQRHSDLVAREADLAAQRDRIRSETLRRHFGEAV